jgi:hypothetical protein
MVIVSTIGRNRQKIVNVVVCVRMCRVRLIPTRPATALRWQTHLCLQARPSLFWSNCVTEGLCQTGGSQIKWMGFSGFCSAKS